MVRGSECSDARRPPRAERIVGVGHCDADRIHGPAEAVHDPAVGVVVEEDALVPARTILSARRQNVLAPSRRSTLPTGRRP